MHTNQWKYKHNNPNLWDSVKGKVHTLQAYLKKQEKNLKKNNLTINLKKLEKEEIKKPRGSRKKERKVRPKINEK